MIGEDPMLDEVWFCDFLPKVKQTQAENFRKGLNSGANNGLNILCVG